MNYMKTRQLIFSGVVFYLTVALLGCTVNECRECDRSGYVPTDKECDFLGITNKHMLSAASRRALQWPKIGNEWFGEFQVFDLKGDLAYEEGIVRRDPSAVIKVHDPCILFFKGKFCLYLQG